MRLIFEHPCQHAARRRFSPTVAYLCYEPNPTINMRQLLVLAERLVRPVGSTRIVPLRQYDGKQSILAFDLDRAEQLISGRAAEAYALVGCADPDLIRASLENPGLADEAALASTFAEGAVVFFHEGHHSIEIIGAPSYVKECLRALLECEG